MKRLLSKIKKTLWLFSAPVLNARLIEALCRIESLEAELKEARTQQRTVYIREPTRAELPLIAAEIHRTVKAQIINELTPMLTKEAAYQLSRMVNTVERYDRPPRMMAGVIADGTMAEAEVEFQLPEMHRTLRVLI